MNSLFITGASGFIGRNLLSNINYNRYEHVYCLSRHHGNIHDFAMQKKNIKIIEGDLFNTSTYEEYLNKDTHVIHMAAITGKARPPDYFSVNTEGTRLLVEKCEQAAVKNFLFVSTIAVKYQDKQYYYYAQSKELAEAAVTQSRLHFAIVRPTMVIGTGGAIWGHLAKMARLPIIPIFGSGTTPIQPIYIDDLVMAMLSILDDGLFTNEIFELGGSDTVTFETFLRHIQRVVRPQGARFAHLPLRPLLGALARVEKYADALLPVSAGQLSVFLNDGTIESNPVFRRLRPQMKTLPEMLQMVTDHDRL